MVLREPSNKSKKKRTRHLRRSLERTFICRTVIGTFVVPSFILLWYIVIFYVHSSIDSALLDRIPISSHPGVGRSAKETVHRLAAVPNKVLAEKNTATMRSIDTSPNNPWEGWQPEISSTMECEWRKCFKESHNCQTCRDSIKDMGPAPPVDVLDNNNWIPDVTMLRRMFLNQRDASGNPWPPPLPDELCERIGVFGGKGDSNIELLEAVPIVAEPMDKEEVASSSSPSSPLPKVLCLMYTMEDAHHKQLRAIRETWAGGCDGFLAFSTASDPRIPAISIPHDGPEEYGNMWQKVRSIWRFVGAHYLDDFDYFFIGGDDLFVLPQNLREYLSTLGSGNKNGTDSEEDHFVGRRFLGYGAKDNYFNSGGAGYALSRGLLRKFVANLDHEKCNPRQHTAMEDVMIASCLRKVLGVGLTDTRDEKGRERFHPFSPGSHYTWKPPKKGAPSDWYEEYNKEWPVKLGADCCAPDSVSFHYIKKPAMVRHIYQLLYNCKRKR